MRLVRAARAEARTAVRSHHCRRSKLSPYRPQYDSHYCHYCHYNSHYCHYCHGCHYCRLQEEQASQAARTAARTATGSSTFPVGGVGGGDRAVAASTKEQARQSGEGLRRALESLQTQTVELHALIECNVWGVSASAR